MKKIVIAILVIIILIFAYGQYKEYQRFHPKNANVKISETVDLNYYNQETVYDYYEALEEANNYMQMQWSANEIDVRSPESDNEETTLAVAEYGRKTAKLNFLKARLESSATLKSQGLTNQDIKLIEAKGITTEAFNKLKKQETDSQMLFESMPKKALYSGERSAFIYELQKLLVKKGHDIPVDGVYDRITSDAIKTFEEKQQLYADGKIDAMTLKALLN